MTAAGNLDRERIASLKRREDAAFVAAREPHVHALAALFSPESGVLDAEELVKALLRSGETDGVIFLQNAALRGAEPHAPSSQEVAALEEVLAATNELHEDMRPLTAYLYGLTNADTRDEQAAGTIAKKRE